MLRDAGQSTELQQGVSEHQKIKKAFSEASKSGAKRAIFVKKEELDAGRVIVKDLRSGTQITVAIADILSLAVDQLYENNSS